MNRVEVTRCMDCPFQSTGWWCDAVPRPSMAEIDEVNRAYNDEGADVFLRVRGYTGSGIDGTPDWCPLRAGPVVVSLRLQGVEEAT